MKDTIITARQKKREIVTYIICLILAFGLNIYAISRYGTSWKELWTQLPWVLLWGTGLWALWLVLRWIWYGILRLVCRKRRA
jgi:hypothetical protein